MTFNDMLQCECACRLIYGTEIVERHERGMCRKFTDIASRFTLNTQDDCTQRFMAVNDIAQRKL